MDQGPANMIESEIGVVEKEISDRLETRDEDRHEIGFFVEYLDARTFDNEKLGKVGVYIKVGACKPIRWRARRGYPDAGAMSRLLNCLYTSQVLMQH